MSLIIFAIPAFFALIGVEIWAAHKRKIAAYRFNDSIADLSCGVLSRVTGAVVAIVSVGAYAWVEARFGWFEIDAASALSWALCFIGVDFFYYWFHRFSHQLNFLWAAHVVHHQSEEYNLAVALRQSVLQGVFAWPFYLPLAFLGFPLPMYLTLASINTIYQFWIHTRLIGRMGFLEHFLNTPSHHRVHHGQNPQYIDRNHGGTLIIWDKLFGTFEPEEEEVVYGVTEPLESWDPIWANAHTWVTTAQRARSFDRFTDKILVWFKRPGWSPTPTDKAWSPAPKYDTPINARMIASVVVAFIGVVGATLFYMAKFKTGSALESGALAGGIVIGLSVCAALLRVGVDELEGR